MPSTSPPRKEDMRRRSSLTPEAPLSPRESKKVEWDTPISRHMETKQALYSSSSSKSGMSSEKTNNVSVKTETYESETQRDSYRRSPKEFNSDSLPRRSSSGDLALGTDYKSDRIDDLERTVDRLKNALVSLEEDNLNLNKKIRESQSEGSGSASSTNHRISNLKDSEDRCVLLENEKRDLQRKLKKTDYYCKECARELKRILHKYEDLKALNKTLDKHNKILAMDNGRLNDTLEAERARGRPANQSLPREPKDGGNGKVWTQLEKVTGQCAQLNHEKGQLEGRVASLAGEVSQLMEELELSRAEVQRLGARRRSSLEVGARDRSPPPPGSRHPAERILDSVGREREAMSGAVAKLREENQALREKLERSVRRGEEAEGRSMRLREEQALLESCLLTVQKEKDLLHLEVRQLHQEYIDLSNSISQQLRERSPQPSRRGPVAMDTRRCPVATATRQSPQATMELAGSHDVTNSAGSGGAEARQDSPKQPLLHTSPMSREMLDGPMVIDCVGVEAIDQIRQRFEEEEQRRAQRYKNIINQNQSG